MSKEEETPSFRMPLNYCPKCHSKLDGATPADNYKEHPTEGDITFCMYCGAVLVFTEELGLRLMKDNEVDDLDAQTVHMIAMTLRVLNAFIRDRAAERARNN